MAIDKLMSEDWEKITKSDLLLAGWHSVYEGEFYRELWHHPKVLGGHTRSGAKYIQFTHAERLSDE